MSRHTVVTSISIDPDLREQSRPMLESLNLGLSQYIDMALRQLVVQRRVPFLMEAPAEPADAS